MDIFLCCCVPVIGAVGLIALACYAFGKLHYNATGGEPVRWE